MSDSINVDVSDLPNVTADAIVAPLGDLDIGPAGVKIKDSSLNKFIPSGGDINQVLAKLSTDNYDVDWVDPAGGGESGSVSGGVDWLGQFQNAAAEQVHFAVKLIGGTAGASLYGFRFKFMGYAKGGTAITFTPRLRLSATQFAVGATLLLTGPSFVSGANSSQKAWEIDAVVLFPDITHAHNSMSIIEHTSDAGGLAKVDCTNNLATDIATGSMTTDKFVQLTWQMSAITGSPNVDTERCIFQTIDYNAGN